MARQIHSSEPAYSGCGVWQRSVVRKRRLGTGKRNAAVACGHCGDHWRNEMITNDKEFRVTRERIARFQEQVAHLRTVETNPANYHSSASGFLAEIDRM